MNKYYISNAVYDEINKVLEIEWTIDEVWNHYDVPRDIYLKLFSAKNKEDFYLENIREQYKARQKWRNLEELLKIAAEILLIDDLSGGVNSKNSSNESAMHLAAFWGDIKAIELLASMGAKIDPPGDCDCTPLYDAVSFENIEATQLLLKLGASPFTNNDLGYTPYEKAKLSGNLDLIKAFSKYVENENRK